jgi:RimJ/RimL family protein N-acetyltransferase
MAAERVTLRDGAVVLVRPVEPADKAAMVEGFERFGDQSRRQRFFAPKRALTPRDLARFTEVDHDEAECLVGLDATTGAGAGAARFERLRPGGSVAEVSVSVVDDWQGRGLAGVLLQRLCRRAGELGVETFRASVLVGNPAMRRAFERLGRVTDRGRDAGVAELDIELPVATAPAALRRALRGPE